MESPQLSSFSSRYRKDGLVVLAIHVDTDPESDVVRFAELLKLDQHVMVKGAEVADKFNILRWPSNVWTTPVGCTCLKPSASPKCSTPIRCNPSLPAEKASWSSPISAGMVRR